VVDDPEYGPEAVNVADQSRDPGSLLNWMERVIRARKDCPEVGWGAWEILEAGHPALLAIRYDWEGRTLLALHNLSGDEAAGEIDAEGVDPDLLQELLGRGDHRPRPGERLEVSLPRYGYRWLRAASP
jgi:maltose alpha-D-glucosyltransferase/alpha-amylase